MRVSISNTNITGDSPPTTLLKPYEGDQGAFRFVSDPTRGTIALNHIFANTVTWIVGIGFNAVAWGFILFLKHLSSTQPNPPPVWFIDVFQFFAGFATVMTLVVGPAVMFLINRKKKPRLLFDGTSLSYPSLPDWNAIDLTGATGVAFIRGGYKETEGQKREFGSLYQIAVRFKGTDAAYWRPVTGFSFDRRVVRRFAQELARIRGVAFYETKATECVPFQELAWTKRMLVPVCKQTPFKFVAQTRDDKSASGG